MIKKKQQQRQGRTHIKLTSRVGTALHRSSTIMAAVINKQLVWRLPRLSPPQHQGTCTE
jgi:hypothetical protein